MTGPLAYYSHHYSFANHVADMFMHAVIRRTVSVATRALACANAGHLRGGDRGNLGVEQEADMVTASKPEPQPAPIPDPAPPPPPSPPIPQSPGV